MAKKTALLIERGDDPAMRERGREGEGGRGREEGQEGEREGVSLLLINPPTARSVGLFFDSQSSVFLSLSLLQVIIQCSVELIQYPAHTCTHARTHVHTHTSH